MWDCSYWKVLSQRAHWILTSTSLCFRMTCLFKSCFLLLIKEHSSHLNAKTSEFVSLWTSFMWLHKFLLVICLSHSGQCFLSLILELFSFAHWKVLSCDKRTWCRSAPTEANVASHLSHYFLTVSGAWALFKCLFKLWLFAKFLKQIGQDVSYTWRL